MGLQGPRVVTRRALAVTHFSTADVIGGSARSAHRIHTGLRARGVTSRMLVGIRAGTDPDVDTVHVGRLGRWADRIADKLWRFTGFQYRYYPSGHRVRRHPWVRRTDVIQLFNTHGGYFSPRLLADLGRRAPIVWRLSDLWPMTGHCAYPGPCDRWRDGCGQCPDLASYPSLPRDTTASLFRQKAGIYAGLPLTIVATSRWIAECARTSPLLGRFPVVRIANGLDGTVFRPLPRDEARRRLELAPAERIVLFSAHILDDNPRKGGDLLIGALRAMEERTDVRLLLVGEGGRSWEGQVPAPVTRLGFVDDPEALAWVYAAADVVAIPSRVENLPNVLVEALACSRPVVACDAGGMADGVRHLETGYLARPEDSADVATGLGLILGDSVLSQKMGRRARTLFEAEFTAEREIDRFVELYEALTGEHPETTNSLKGTRP